MTGPSHCVSGSIGKTGLGRFFHEYLVNTGDVRPFVSTKNMSSNLMYSEDVPLIVRFGENGGKRVALCP